MRAAQIIFILFIFFCSVPGVCVSAEVRVAIIQDAGSLNIKIAGHYEIYDSSAALLARGRSLNTTATCYKGGILLAGKVFNTARLELKAFGPDIAVINGRVFKGKIQLIINKNSKLTVVNRLGLEDYVKGILYNEASHYWPMEALKAQAVVSRTYAVYQAQENRGKDFDVTADIYSQVYGGKTSERGRTNKAVEETAGEVITYKGRAIPAYFHATCAGRTEDASELWNVNLAPLKGVACGFCKDSPHFNWHYVASLDELRGKLSEAGRKAGAIKNIAVSARNNSGRITDLRIITSQGELLMTAKDFRSIIGPNIIRSLNFTVKVVEKDAVFEGAGWGHGVGLCQWGAYFMAKQGKGSGEILKYYYPGSDVKTIGL